MNLDQAVSLERRRTEAAGKLAKLQTVDWWHCGEWTDAHYGTIAA